jgi:signal-transduction protein with cAMP-binding, CBS, and nucleotidyltransferase domain
MSKAVREAMMPEPLTIDAQDSIVDAAQRMRAWDVNDVLVVEDHDVFVGRLTDRDIVVLAIASGRHPAELTAGECADPTLPTVAPGDPLDRAAVVAGRHRLQRLPVVEGGRLLGTVWAADLPPVTRRRAADLR